MPYMSIETLRLPLDSPFKYHAGHNLESLLYTMLTLCTYTVGPGGQLRENTNDDISKSIKLNEWFSIALRLPLAEKKAFTLESYDTFIQPDLPQYWQDFSPYLQRLINATWNKQILYRADNIATHQAYRTILMDALEKYTKEETKELAVYAFVPKAKRQINNSTSPRKAKRTRLDNDADRDSDDAVFIPRGTQTCFLDDYEESCEEYGESSSES